ncbi:MAG: hypothetical protein FWD17_09895, partial [Polyangiaceae bacterium]|nr:hypothetical protein [Polyangiaceae bacterium]
MLHLARSFLVVATLAVAALTPESAAGQALDEPVQSPDEPRPQANVVVPSEPPTPPEPPPAPDPAVSPGAAPCVAWDVTYALSGMIRISDTPMAAGDGTHSVGPGELVLRFDDRGGAPGGKARATSFDLTEHFAVHPQAVLWNARLVTDAHARAAADGAGPAAVGMLVGDTLRWESPIRGYRTDGALTCDGSLCGR